MAHLIQKQLLLNSNYTYSPIANAMISPIYCHACTICDLYFNNDLICTMQLSANDWVGLALTIEVYERAFFAMSELPSEISHT